MGIFDSFGSDTLDMLGASGDSQMFQEMSRQAMPSAGAGGGSNINRAAQRSLLYQMFRRQPAMRRMPGTGGYSGPRGGPSSGGIDTQGAFDPSTVDPDKINAALGQYGSQLPTHINPFLVFNDEKSDGSPSWAGNHPHIAHGIEGALMGLATPDGRNWSETLSNVAHTALGIRGAYAQNAQNQYDAPFEMAGRMAKIQAAQDEHNLKTAQTGYYQNRDDVAAGKINATRPAMDANGNTLVYKEGSGWSPLPAPDADRRKAFVEQRMHEHLLNPADPDNPTPWTAVDEAKAHAEYDSLTRTALEGKVITGDAQAHVADIKARAKKAGVGGTTKKQLDWEHSRLQKEVDDTEKDYDTYKAGDPTEIHKLYKRYGVNSIADLNTAMGRRRQSAGDDLQKFIHNPIINGPIPGATQRGLTSPGGKGPGAGQIDMKSLVSSILGK